MKFRVSSNLRSFSKSTSFTLAGGVAFLLAIAATSFFVQKVFAQMPVPRFREATVLVPRGSIYYKVMGKGQPIILVHGGPGLDHRYMFQAFQDLAKDYRVIFYDQRGTGASQCKLSDRSVTIEQFVEDLDAVRRHLGLRRINLLGHSWGGLLAVHYTVRHPQNVRSLMLANSSGLTGESQKAFFENLDSMRTPEEKEELESLKGKADQESLQRHNELYMRPYFYDPSKIALLSYEPSKLTAENNERVRTLIWRQLLDYDLRPQASRLHIPTLVIHSDRDVIPLEVAEETAETIPRSELVVMQDVGHYSFIEDPTEFFKEIRKFLKTVHGP